MNTWKHKNTLQTTLNSILGIKKQGKDSGLREERKDLSTERQKDSQLILQYATLPQSSKIPPVPKRTFNR